MDERYIEIIVMDTSYSGAIFPLSHQEALRSGVLERDLHQFPIYDLSDRGVSGGIVKALCLSADTEGQVMSRWEMVSTASLHHLHIGRSPCVVASMR